jgi:hypothetical protein
MWLQPWFFSMRLEHLGHGLVLARIQLAVSDSLRHFSFWRGTVLGIDYVDVEESFSDKSGHNGRKAPSEQVPSHVDAISSIVSCYKCDRRLSFLFSKMATTGPASPLRSYRRRARKALWQGAI